MFRSQWRVDGLGILLFEPLDQFGGRQDSGHAADALA
jgi:hypothetical protein